LPLFQTESSYTAFYRIASHEDSVWHQGRRKLGHGLFLFRHFFLQDLEDAFAKRKWGTDNARLYFGDDYNNKRIGSWFAVDKSPQWLRIDLAQTKTSSGIATEG